MNGFDPLEERLGRLQAAQLSDAFMARLEALRPRPAAPKMEKREPTPWLAVLLMRWFWVPAGAAFALLLAVLLTRQPLAPLENKTAASAPKENCRVFVPSQIDKYLLDARDVGIGADAQGRMYRLVRCEWIDRETYHEDRGDSRLQIVKANEQIVPVALEFY